MTHEVCVMFPRHSVHRWNKNISLNFLRGENFWKTKKNCPVRKCNPGNLRSGQSCYIETTKERLTILTMESIHVISDDDVGDVVRCSEVDAPPRMHVVIGARRRIIATVNSQTCHLHVIRADLTCRLVQCDVVQDVDCTKFSHNSSRYCSHSKAHV